MKCILRRLCIMFSLIPLAAASVIWYIGGPIVLWVIYGGHPVDAIRIAECHITKVWCRIMKWGDMNG